MRVIASRVLPANANTSLLVLGAFEGELSICGPLGAVNSALWHQAHDEKFSGKLGEIVTSYAPGSSIGAKRVVLVGLGSRTTFGATALRKALTAAFKQAKAHKVTEVTVAPLPEGTEISAQEYGETVAVIAGLVDYVINHQKTAGGGHKPEKHISELRLLVDRDTESGARAGLIAGNIIAQAVNYARDLSNEPAGTLTPSKLADEAERVAAQSRGRITCKVLRKAELEKLGAKALLAVSQGSVQEPVLIELTYTPACGAGRDLLALVGKSVTFDSGGLDIKTADGMRTMKRDMSGGASVLAAIGAIAALRIPVAVKAFMAATENMVDGNSYKPGDVLNTLNGLTVEVDNTDAEGRLTLADAIEYAKRQGVTHIIDLATLTGAVRAIGADVGAASFGNNDAFTSTVSGAAERAGERLVAMPMWEEFREGNKSDMADLKNSGGDPGSITAAWFLREFAGEEIPWVHLDIAGPSYRARELGADPKGCTGYGVRTLVELARIFCER